MVQTLWHHFTNALLENAKGGAVGIISKCLAEMATKQKIQNLGDVDPVTLAVRLLVCLLLAHPCEEPLDSICRRHYLQPPWNVTSRGYIFFQP